MKSLALQPCPVSIRAISFPQVAGGAHLVLSAEERISPEPYDWYGHRRRETAKRPVVLFQYTLTGYGCFESEGKVEQVTPGRGFVALIPSPHRYWLPPEGCRWFFFWAMTDHPFVVERLSQLSGKTGGVLNIAPESAPITLLHRMLHRPWADAYETEADLLRLGIGLEQAATPANLPTLMGQVRQLIGERLASPFGVEELAKWCGMSRTHFSHRFKEETGMAPSDFIREIRLEAALEYLRQERLPLKVIADRTGFADANHFCKAFRRRFALTPGEYRKNGSRDFTALEKRSLPGHRNSEQK